MVTKSVMFYMVQQDGIRVSPIQGVVGNSSSPTSSSISHSWFRSNSPIFRVYFSPNVSIASGSVKSVAGLDCSLDESERSERSRFFIAVRNSFFSELRAEEISTAVEAFKILSKNESMLSESFSAWVRFGMEAFCHRQWAAPLQVTVTKRKVKRPRDHPQNPAQS